MLCAKNQHNIVAAVLLIPHHYGSFCERFHSRGRLGDVKWHPDAAHAHSVGNPLCNGFDCFPLGIVQATDDVVGVGEVFPGSVAHSAPVSAYT